jgi:hypothetical protein
LPAAQAMHAAASESTPVLPLPDVPAAHDCVQASAELACPTAASPHFPNTHSVHDSFCPPSLGDEGWYLPAAQSTHAVTPVAKGWDWPAAQSKHAVPTLLSPGGATFSPSVPDLPAAHASHSVLALRPDVCLPVGQFVQGCCPVPLNSPLSHFAADTVPTHTSSTMRSAHAGRAIPAPSCLPYVLEYLSVRHLTPHFLGSRSECSRVVGVRWVCIWGCVFVGWVVGCYCWFRELISHQPLRRAEFNVMAWPRLPAGGVVPSNSHWCLL